jgi:cytochrome b involved in lipid metabolism
MNPFLSALASHEATPEPWLRRALESELEELRRVVGERADLGPLGGGNLLLEVQRRAQSAEPRVARLFQRVSWLIEPGERDAIERLDPLVDRDRIFHFVAREFRSELKVFAVLHEMRAAVSLPLATFFLQTGEFSERGVKRIVDTVLLVCNVLEWGTESLRGRRCLERINAIHSRYAIPNAAFKFVLCGIMFVPWEFNQRFGFRRMSFVERLGWFHAFDQLGRAMGIGELDGDFDATYAWYREVSHAGARFAPNKQRLVRDILGQVLARYPTELRGVIASAFVAGMDDVYLTAAALPRAPEVVTRALARLFAAPELRAVPHGGYWMQSLLPSSVYPDGYLLEELGAGSRSSPPQVPLGERSISERELAERAAAGEWLVVLDGAVYDVGHFAEHHPGGRALLERHLGRDATLAFDAGPHSAATRVFRENYRVGVLEVLKADGLPTDSVAPKTDGALNELSSEVVLGVSRTRRAPEPVIATSLRDFAEALLPLVNARSREVMTEADVERQLQRLCQGEASAL